MRILKNIWRQLHRFVFWAVILSLLWCWVYTFVGDTGADRKVVFYIDAYALERRPLSIRLEEEGLPEGIRMIQARSFDYDLFGSSLNGDLYLMKESILKATLEESPEKLAALTLPDGLTGYDWEGSTVAILAFDPATQRGPAMEYISYALYDTPEPEPYYLCFDAASLHLSTNAAAVDNAAWEVATNFLHLP